jgi:hypothetical protein
VKLKNTFKRFLDTLLIIFNFRYSTIRLNAQFTFPVFQFGKFLFYKKTDLRIICTCIPKNFHHPKPNFEKRFESFLIQPLQRSFTFAGPSKYILGFILVHCHTIQFFLISNSFCRHVYSDCDALLLLGKFFLAERDDFRCLPTIRQKNFQSRRFRDSAETPPFEIQV